MNDEMLKDFATETNDLLKQMSAALEVVESDQTALNKLEEYGNLVDRIMGGAKLLAMSYPADHLTHVIGAVSEVCKAIAYKASQTHDNKELVSIVISFLWDATETIENLNKGLEKGSVEKGQMTDMFLDRLRWIVGKFDENTRGTVGSTTGVKTANPSIDVSNLMKSLGVKKA